MNERLAVAAMWFAGVWVLFYLMYGANILPDNVDYEGPAITADMCSRDK